MFTLAGGKKGGVKNGTPYQVVANWRGCDCYCMYDTISTIFYF